MLPTQSHTQFNIIHDNDKFWPPRQRRWWCFKCRWGVCCRWRSDPVRRRQQLVSATVHWVRKRLVEGTVPMSIGLMNQNNKSLFSFKQEPWSLLPKSFVGSHSNEYVNNIVWRANLFSIMPVPCPSNWFLGHRHWNGLSEIPFVMLLTLTFSLTKCWGYKTSW